MSDQDYFENTQFGSNAMNGTSAGISPIDIAAFTRFVVAQNSANPIF